MDISEKKKTFDVILDAFQKSKLEVTNTSRRSVHTKDSRKCLAEF